MVLQATHLNPLLALLQAPVRLRRERLPVQPRQGQLQARLLLGRFLVRRRRQVCPFSKSHYALVALIPC